MSRARALAPFVAALSFLLTSGLSLGETESFTVIVHPSNPAGPMSRAEVSDLFLRRATQWDSGPRVRPVNLLPRSPLRQAFSQAIHRKSLAGERAYWQRQIFTGRGVPPLEVTTEDDVLDYVAANPGAVGYVSRGKLDSRVRELEIRDIELGAGGSP